MYAWEGEVISVISGRVLQLHGCSEWWCHTCLTSMMMIVACACLAVVSQKAEEHTKKSALKRP